MLYSSQRNTRLPHIKSINRIPLFCEHFFEAHVLGTPALIWFNIWVERPEFD
jgi:hypothetical protein